MWRVLRHFTSLQIGSAALKPYRYQSPPGPATRSRGACSPGFDAKPRALTVGDTDPPAGPQITEVAEAAPPPWQPRISLLRHRTSAARGLLIPGTDLHRIETCLVFRETFNPPKPRGPALEPDAQARLVSLPIWDIAVQTEGKPRVRMLVVCAQPEASGVARGDRTQRPGGGPAQGGATRMALRLMRRGRKVQATGLSWPARKTPPGF